MRRNSFILLILILMLAAACSSTSATPTAQPDATPTSETVAGGAQSANPAWLTSPVVNAHTGETFTLADFAGKTVWVEPMATWCTTCRGQLPRVEAARAALDSNQYVFISFSVAENVDNATLTQYADDQGWHWTFAVATEALTQGMVDTFGRTVVTPPSTPHFIIRPDGSVTEIATGQPTTDEIVAELKAASGT